jgi:chromosome partitioning protein
MPRTLAVSSQKGGIGKTTTVTNLALAWGALGLRVLAADLDPQFALTRRFGRSPAEVPATVFELLAGDGELGAAAVAVAPSVDLLAGRRELAKLELSLASEHHREQFLADMLAAEAGDYDVVLIDCPPNLGLLTVNAIVASSEVLVPVNMTDEGALQGAAEVRAIVDQLARRSEVRARALVRQMVDRRRVVYQQMNAGLRELGLPIAATEIPLRADFQNAAAERVALFDWRSDSIGAHAYRLLAAELEDGMGSAVTA